jgi:hypothetical protein
MLTFAEPLGDFHHFEVSSSTWTDLTDQTQGVYPTAGYGYGFAAAEDNLYLFGGCRNNFKGRFAAHQCARESLSAQQT